MEKQMEVAVNDAGCVLNTIKQLVGEFKGLHEHRLRCLEHNSSDNHNVLLQKKVNFLLSYLNDLTDQNQMLVQTIEDLQNEAEGHTSNLTSDAEMETLLLDELVGPTAHTQHRMGSFERLASDWEDLKNQPQTKDVVASDLRRECGRSIQPAQKLGELSTRTEPLQEEQEARDGERRLREAAERRRLDGERQEAEERGRRELCAREEEWRRATEEERKAHAAQVQKQAEREALLDSELQVSRRALSNARRFLDQARTKLSSERQRRWRRRQIQEETERLRREAERARGAAEKKLLSRDKALEKLSKERDELRARMEDQAARSVNLSHTNKKLEADLAVRRDKMHTLHLEVRSRDQFILQLRAEMKAAEQKHLKTQEQVLVLEERLKDGESRTELLHRELNVAKEALEGADAEAREHIETAGIFKDKYMAAMKKVHEVQGQAKHLQEELQYSQQQLQEAQQATRLAEDELAEMTQRHREKVGHWESAQEALDQLTDELQASQDLVQESRQGADHLRSRLGTLQEQVEALEQQKLTLECNFHLYQQSHSHSDEDYLGLLRHSEQLENRCTEQVGRLALCEKAILQIKSELERRGEEKAALKQSLAASRCEHAGHQGRLKQEVLRLSNEAARLKAELADAREVHAELLRQTEEKLTEAGQEVVKAAAEAALLRGDVQRLREEKEEKEEKVEEQLKEQLSRHVGQMSRELEVLRAEHRVAVEELAARAEEARRMEERLNEGKLAEGKMRSVAARVPSEADELRRNLRQALDRRVQAERETQEAEDKVHSLRAELEQKQSDCEKLRHESQQVVTNVNKWITEQMTSNENLSAQIKAQHKVLLVITQEKERLQEANDTLRAAAEEGQRESGGVRGLDGRRCERSWEKEARVASNLSKMDDMQARLRRNLEAIGMLNQQLNALSGENKRLRQQLQRERSLRLTAPRPLLPT